MKAVHAIDEGISVCQQIYGVAFVFIHNTNLSWCMYNDFTYSRLS